MKSLNNYRNINGGGEWKWDLIFYWRELKTLNLTRVATDIDSFAPFLVRFFQPFCANNLNVQTRSKGFFLNSISIVRLEFFWTRMGFWLFFLHIFDIFAYIQYMLWGIRRREKKDLKKIKIQFQSNRCGQ